MQATDMRDYDQLMACDEDIAERIRALATDEAGLTEKRMFRTERDLGSWVARGVTYARSLPAK